MPTTVPSSTITSSTVKPSRTSAPARSGSVDEDLVEQRAARRVRRSVAVRRPGAAGDGEQAEVERVGVDGRAAGRDDLVEEAPAPQRGDSRCMDHVRRQRVARERRPVDHEHLVALAGEQHRSRGACAAGTHHDRVIGLRHGWHHAPSGGRRGIGEVPYSAADFARAA